MTPLQIEIGLHYYCRVNDCPVIESPAGKQALGMFLDAGMLEYDGINDRYRKTDGLDVWVEWLMRVPLPVRRWQMPKSLSIFGDDEIKPA